MKFSKLVLLSCLMASLLGSCRKAHYDLDNVHGLNAQGELLLPIARKSVTMMDMMQRFQIDSLIDCNADGTLSYNYSYEHFGAVKGEELLRFNDLNYEEHFAFENPFPVVLPQAFDTMLHFNHKILFEADHISVLEAMMRSGRFDFDIQTNIGLLRRAVIRSSDIKDGAGNDLELDFQINADSIGFDLGGMRYETDSANTLNLSYDLYFRIQGSTNDELFFDIDIKGRDLAIQEMRGFVESYGSESRIDTAFNLFPDNIIGSLEINGARLHLSERNTFGLAARLELDTALVSGEGIAPYSLFDPMPVVVDLPSQLTFAEVFNQSLNGQLNASSSRVYSVSNFIVNPSGFSDMVSVADTCNIDVRVDVNIPFAFAVEDVRYLDTVHLELSEINMPDMIESITLEMTFNSTLPLNLGGRFYMYDSESDKITDTLVANDEIIRASFDGQPTTTEVSIEITENRIEKVLHSDRIIMLYELDTDARDVVLNANQKLELYVKTKVKYDGVVEI